MSVVVDASAVVAALVDGGAIGDWARSAFAGSPLAAPHAMPVEVASVLRRQIMRGRVSVAVATLAHAELADLSIELFPYAPSSRRVWELRENLTSYDAWYVALAEQLDAPLVTLDKRMAVASGPRCEFRLPPR